jgi:glycine cleavage system H lipoate-binding protein
MPWTNFPNGISVTTATGTASGQVTATSVSAVGISCTSITATSLTVTGGSVIGERLAITGTFTSAAGTTYTPLPFAGQLVDFNVVLDTSPRKISALTVRGGSAGAVSVASTTAVSCGSALTVASPGITMGSATVSLTTTNTYALVSALNVTVTTAGTAVNGQWTAVIERTA